MHKRESDVNIRRALLVSALIGSVGACATTPHTPSGAEADIRAAYADIVEAIASCDAERYAAHIHADALVWYPYERSPIREVESIDQVARACENGSKPEVLLDVWAVKPAAGALVAYGVFSYTQVGANGAIVFEDRARFSEVWTPSPDGWRLQHGHIGLLNGSDGLPQKPLPAPASDS